ncbi:hypothetical protein LK533_12180 [Sphingomonas sp. PL-96]|uniref:hypothetical protein n=1 Tax=Sphingomonas sp. PL-96 TaxID=2887201 RepID=UPI001E560753|nr:hypothetical protein [Sphingomonas sp. PL-96]MCC2977429.1 hypothetical protein [Sphingomonas sp. PL-96]
MTTSRSRRPAPRKGGGGGRLLATLLVVAVTVGMGALLLWPREAERREPLRVASPRPAPAAPPKPTGVRALPAAEQLARAAKAVFGPSGKATETRDGAQVITTPARLVWRGDTAVLVSAAEMVDACHGCTGALDIAYLKPQGDGFALVRRWPDAVPGSSWGAPPSEWSISDRFGPNPVLYASGGGTWQGYTCSVFTLTELGAGGPVGLVSAPEGYDDTGAGTAETPTTLEGKIANIVPGRSFDVTYTGTQHFTDQYVRQGDKYAVRGEMRMRTC